jgi:hypothetical protein
VTIPIDPPQTTPKYYKETMRSYNNTYTSYNNNYYYYNNKTKNTNKNKKTTKAARGLEWYDPCEYRDARGLEWYDPCEYRNAKGLEWNPHEDYETNNLGHSMNYQSTSTIHCGPIKPTTQVSAIPQQSYQKLSLQDLGEYNLRALEEGNYYNGSACMTVGPLGMKSPSFPQ